MQKIKKQKHINYFKVIVAGGRTFKDYPLLKEKLDKILENKQHIEIVSGCANGADRLGEKYAKEKEYPIRFMPAQWNDFTPPCKIKTNRYGHDYNALAGHNRNRDMAEYADALVAFWDKKSKGTLNMIETAEELGLPTRIIYY